MDDQHHPMAQGGALRRVLCADRREALFPIRTQDALARMLGVSSTMDEFQGHAGRKQ